MGLQRFKRIATDSQGNKVSIIEWHGDHGTAHMHDGSDLKDPRFYSRYTLLDEVTRLEMEPDRRTLRNLATGDEYVLKSSSVES